MKKLILITLWCSLINAKDIANINDMTTEEYNLYQNALYYGNDVLYNTFFYLNKINTPAAKRVAKYIKRCARQSAQDAKEVQK